mgnify:CR=1 FL=1
MYRTYPNRTERAIEQVNTSLNQRVRANGVYHIQYVNVSVGSEDQVIKSIMTQ